MNLQAWQAGLQRSMISLWERFTEYIPNIAAALAILFLGYVISKLLQKISEKVLVKAKLDTLSDKIGVHTALGKIGVSKKLSAIVGVLIFWTIMLTFLISASDSLGLQKVTQAVDSLLMYLPNVFGAIVVLVLGVMLTQFLGKAVKNSSKQLGLGYADLLSSVTKGLLFVIVTVLAVSQLEIETRLVDNILQILLISAGGILVLSLGLGTRTLSKNMVFGVFAKNQFRSNSEITINGKSGTLVEIGALNSILVTKDKKRIHIPNSSFMEMEVIEKGGMDESRVNYLERNEHRGPNQ